MLRRLQRDRLGGEFVGRVNAGDRAFQFPAAFSQLRSEEVDDCCGDLEARVLICLVLDAARQDLVAQVIVHRAKLCDQPAGQPRAHPRIEAFKLHRHAVRRDDDLFSAVDERIEGVAELLLEGAALEELHVVDQQYVDVAQPVLIGRPPARLQRLRKAVHEALSRQIEQLGIRFALFHAPSDGVEQMSLAEPHSAMEVKRIVARRLFASAVDDLQRGRVREPVGIADQERAEGETHVEWRAFEAFAACARVDGGFDGGRLRGGRRLPLCIASSGRLVDAHGVVWLTHPEFQPLDVIELGAATLQEMLRIMRAQPFA